MYIISDIFYFIIGWLFLWIRFRNKEKVKKALIDKYDNSYYDAGALLTFSCIRIVLIGLLGVFLLIVIVRTIYDMINIE